jgi:hypothetical protein
MLGEPGLGKSTEFDCEFTRVKRGAVASADVAVHCDLKEYQTDARLVMDAFESEAVRAWQHGAQVLHLFFDTSVTRSSRSAAGKGANLRCLNRRQLSA